MATNDITSTTAAVHTFRAPIFCSHDPSMWFSILECSFNASRITNSLTKFSHATALLPPDVLTQVSDTITNACTSSSPYEELKAAILSRLESSISARLQELLSKEELGNEKPSDLLRRMKKLLGDKYAAFDKDLFTTLFYQRLPDTIQRNLFSVKNKLTPEELSKLADDFMMSLPVHPTPTVARVAADQDVHHLAKLVTQLTLKVSTIQQQLDDERSRRRSRTPQRYRQRSRSSSNKPGLCYYHRRFGQSAVKCVTPCNFKDLNTNGEH